MVTFKVTCFVVQRLVIVAVAEDAKDPPPAPT